MSNRTKGVWGENPNTRARMRPQPKHYHRPEVKDGCAGILITILLSLLSFVAICQPANFITKTISLDTGSGDEWYDSELSVLFKSDTVQVTAKNGGYVFTETGVTWTRLNEQIWSANQPGQYWMEYSETAAGRALKIKTPTIQMLCLFEGAKRKTERL